MTALMLAIGVMLALAISTLIVKVQSATFRAAILATALLVLLLFVALSSFRYVPENRVGVVVKNVGGQSLPAGKIIATEGEKGPQADILPPGWHAWMWPVIFDVEYAQIVQIESGSVGLLTASDGQPLPTGEIYAPEWEESEVKRLAQDAAYFLTDGGGFKGPQSSVLTPGKYRINPKLFSVEIVPVTNVERGTVAVVKSNVGPVPPAGATTVDRGNRGIWSEPLMPQEYYLNTKSYEVTRVDTAKKVVRFTKANSAGEEDEITVRSSDGFTFPVDVRVEYEIKPVDAPEVVARFKDDGDLLLARLTSSVRSVFRNNAESVKALDYVRQRSLQESQSLTMLQEELSPLGVTVTAVRIGDVGDQETLGQLLQTQTDREIAVQEQLTFQEQQRAAEQRKQLTRTEQEAEEEKRLATARYEVQIAEQDKEKAIIAAQAEAEAIRIRADAQASAFAAIAAEIGSGNAALIEVLKVVGEDGIRITPEVMVSGSGGDTADAETTALIGTMLNELVRDKEEASE